MLACIPAKNLSYVASKAVENGIRNIRVCIDITQRTRGTKHMDVGFVAEATDKVPRFDFMKGQSMVCRREGMGLMARKRFQLLFVPILNSRLMDMREILWMKGMMARMK